MSAGVAQAVPRFPTTIPAATLPSCAASLRVAPEAKQSANTPSAVSRRRLLGPAGARPRQLPARCILRSSPPTHATRWGRVLRERRCAPGGGRARALERPPLPLAPPPRHAGGGGPPPPCPSPPRRP